MSAASTPWVRAGKDCGDEHFLLGTVGGPAVGCWVGVIARAREAAGIETLAPPAREHGRAQALGDSVAPFKAQT